jgi:hypothetical protein
MPNDLAQAAYLELAVMALERHDLPALVGALASLKSSTLDQLTELTAHPTWSALADLTTATRRVGSGTDLES